MDKINLSRPMYVHKMYTDLFLQNYANTCRLICISTLLLYTCIHKRFYSVAIDKGQINIFYFLIMEQECKSNRPNSINN